jgi:hypothetical protein
MSLPQNPRSLFQDVARTIKKGGVIRAPEYHLQTHSASRLPHTTALSPDLAAF